MKLRYGAIFYLNFLILITSSFCKVGGVDLTEQITPERVDALLTRIVNVERHMQENVKNHLDAPRVIVIGNTGSGKSTLVHALTKKPLRVQVAASGPFLEVDGDNIIPNFIIKRGIERGTQQPTSWFDPSTNLVFWDCPGFMDPSGVSRDIETLFAVERLFTPPCNIKILLTIDKNAQQADRGQSIVQRLRNLKNFFTEEEQLRRVVSIVLTKQRSWSDFFPEPSTVFEEMGLFGIEPDAERTRNLATATGITSQELEWISSFLGYLRDNNRIFAFPEPLGAGSYNYDWFPNRERILADLVIESVSNPAINTFANFERDPRILLLMERSAGQLDRAIGQVKDLFLTIKHSTQHNTEKLKKAQSVVKRLSLLPSEVIKTPARLAQQLGNYLDEFEFSEEERNRCTAVIDKLIASETYLNFLDKLDRDRRSEIWQSHIPNISETLKSMSNDSLDTFVQELNEMENSCCIVS